MNDPLSRESALERCKLAGIGAGKWGAAASENPYKGKASMTEEFAKWEAGRSIGASERMAGKRS